MTQPKFKIKKGDTVKVMTGKYKGQTGEVTKVLLDEAMVIVDGVNVVTRNVKPSQVNPDGPYQVTKPIHISNVALVDVSGNHSKVGLKMEDGKKVRYFKKTGELV
ncbi:MAG: 50S ribosomal protein L24 [Holosporales bacterium]